MVAKSLVHDALSLPAADRAELAQRLWESLEPDVSAFPLTPVQTRELERRAAEMDADPELGSSWEAVKARIWPKR